VAQFVSLYEAKTKLSALVDRAAAGEEIIIAKHGIPHAQLVPVASRGRTRTPAGAMRVRWISPDFDAPDAAIEQLFETKGE
jgi:prevent-host-death family protein